MFGSTVLSHRCYCVLKALLVGYSRSRHGRRISHLITAQVKCVLLLVFDKYQITDWPNNSQCLSLRLPLVIKRNEIKFEDNCNMEESLAPKRTLEDLIRDLGLAEGALTTELKVPPKMTPKDVFALTVFLLLSPYILVLYLVIAIYLIAVRLPSLLYVRHLRKIGVRSSIPTTTGFYLFSSMETVLVLPVVAIALAHMIIVQLLAFLFFVPVGLVTGVNVTNNLAVIRGVGDARGSDVHWILSPTRIFELWRCLFGMYDRLGFWQWVLAVSWMTMMNPVLKYFFATNIWLWDLEEKWCNQWTEKFPPSINRKSVQETFVRYISDSFLEDDITLKEIDMACFCAHYAMPPPGCETNCLGMQYAPRKLSTNLTLTRHWHMLDESHSPLSDTGFGAIYEVNLHYFNAWHFLTGYVEANMQHESGGNRFEHPMWIIMPKTGYLGHRLYSAANDLFGEFVIELRSSLLRSNNVME